MAPLDDGRFNCLAVAAVTLGFTLLVMAFAAAIVALIHAQRSYEQVDHTHQVVDQLSEKDVWVERAETASRGHLFVPDNIRGQTFRDSVDRFDSAIRRLDKLIDDNPVQTLNVVALICQMASEISTLERIMGKATSGDVADARALFAREVSKLRVNVIRATAANMRSIEQPLLADRRETERRLLCSSNQSS